MTTKPEGERIASLETAMLGLEKKVDEGFSNISHQIAELSSSIIARNAVVDQRFVNKSEYDARLSIIEKKLGASWVQNTLSAILGVILTSLIGAVFFLITNK
jgi:hypothetical protein